MHASTLATVVLSLSLLTVLPGAALATDRAAPVLVEVQPDPSEASGLGEWVELANPLPVELALDGLYLTDNDPCFAPGQGYVESYTWPLTGTLAPGERIVLELPAHCLTLANSGDDLHLVTEDGQVLQSVAYGDLGKLPTPADGESLSACTMLGNLHGAWQVTGETPGATNPGC